MPWLKAIAFTVHRHPLPSLCLYLRFSLVSFLCVCSFFSFLFLGLDFSILVEEFIDAQLQKWRELNPAYLTC